MKTLYSQLLLFILLLLLSCKSQKENLSDANNISSERTYNPREVFASTKSTEISVVDYIRRLSGVTVRGSGENIAAIVRVGVNSINSGSDPLLLIDGNQFYGTFFEYTITIPANNVESVRVYKTPSETAMYGIRGANGVIDVRLK